MTEEWQSPLGQSLLRREDARLLTGRGQYVSDMDAPGMLCAGVLRSPHARARILSVSLAQARLLPGIVLTLSGEDIAGLPAFAGHEFSHDQALAGPGAAEAAVPAPTLARAVGNPLCR